jgi:hypothetical protein
VINKENWYRHRNVEYIDNKVINSIIDIALIEGTLSMKYVEENPKTDLRMLSILNFQLLDSYNKEEREAKENDEVAI